MLHLFEVSFSYQEPPDGIFSPSFPVIAGLGSTGERFTGNPTSLRIKLKFLRKIDKVKKISLKFIGDAKIDRIISSKSGKDDDYNDDNSNLNVSKNDKDQQNIRFFNYKQVLVDFEDSTHIPTINKYTKDQYEKNEELTLMFEEFRFPYETFILPSTYEYNSVTSPWSLKIRYYLECELIRDTSLNSVTKIRKKLTYQSGHFHNFTNRSNLLDLKFLLDSSDSHLFKNIPKKLSVDNKGNLAENPLPNSRGHLKAIMSLVNPIYKKEKYENLTRDINLDLRIIPNTFSETHNNYFDITSDILNDLGVLEIKTNSVPPEGLVPHFKYYGKSTGLGEFHMTSIKIYLKDTITLRRKQEIICVLDTKRKKIMEKNEKSKKETSRFSINKKKYERNTYSATYDYDSINEATFNGQRNNFQEIENDYFDESGMKFDIADFQKDPNSDDFFTCLDFKDLLTEKEHLFPKPQFGSLSIPKFLENDVSLEVSIKIESRYRNEVFSKTFNFAFGVVLANNKNIHPLDYPTEPQRHCYSGFPIINYLNEGVYKDEFLKNPQKFEDKDTADSSFHEMNSYSSSSSFTKYQNQSNDSPSINSGVNRDSFISYQYQTNDSPPVNSGGDRDNRASYLSVPAEDKYRTYSGTNNSYRDENRNFSRGINFIQGDRFHSRDRSSSRDRNSYAYFDSSAEIVNKKEKYQIKLQERGRTDRNENLTIKVDEHNYSDTNTKHSNSIDLLDDEIPDNCSYFAFPKIKQAENDESDLHYSPSVASSVYPAVNEPSVNKYPNPYSGDRSSRQINLSSRDQTSYRESRAFRPLEKASPRGISPRGFLSRRYDSKVYDSQNYDSHEYGPEEYNSEEYNSKEHGIYNSNGYDSRKEYSSRGYESRVQEPRKLVRAIEENSYLENRHAKGISYQDRNPYETNKTQYLKKGHHLESGFYETENTYLNTESYTGNKSNENGFHKTLSIPTAPLKFSSPSSSFSMIVPSSSPSSPSSLLDSTISHENKFGPYAQSYQNDIGSKADYQKSSSSQNDKLYISTQPRTHRLSKLVVDIDHNKETNNIHSSINGKDSYNKYDKTDNMLDRVPYTENSYSPISSAIGVLQKNMVTSKNQSSDDNSDNYSNMFHTTSPRSFPRGGIKNKQQSGDSYDKYFGKFVSNSDSDSDSDDSLPSPNSIFFNKKSGK